MGHRILGVVVGRRLLGDDRGLIRLVDPVAVRVPAAREECGGGRGLRLVAVASGRTSRVSSTSMSAVTSTSP
ncbi:hypothetical protein SSAG_00878 [Streptomyces sp. Mg1]|nr:hypothetical protein SSAG_00878 [Streptomyces sp. Mg1]